MIEIVSDRSYVLPLESGAVWDAVSDTSNYRIWWPWLTSFEGAELEAGGTWTCAVQPPLPYVLSFTVFLEEVEPRKLIRASFGGDVVGSARIDADDTDAGLSLRLRSAVAPGNRALRVAASLLKPLIRLGHDRVLDEGVRRFAASVSVAG